MKLHRFYVGEIELQKSLWVNDPRLLSQWTRVLRFRPSQQLVLFNEQRQERLYEVVEIAKDGVHVNLVTDMKPHTPERDVYLCFSLLKKDKNDWILQKGTELGVRHFVPLTTSRTEKTGFDMERAQKIVIEAAEQCGRVDIPRMREPMKIETAINELKDKVAMFVAEQGSPDKVVQSDKGVAVFIGPEGGWTDEEKLLFESNQAPGLTLSQFTLRAETAAIVAAARLTSVMPSSGSYIMS